MRNKKALHQPPPELEKAAAMPAEKRKSGRNSHSPFGGMTHTWMPEDEERRKFARKHKGG